MKKNKNRGFGKLILLHNILSSLVIGLFVGFIVTSLLQNRNSIQLSPIPFIFIFTLLFLGIMILTSAKMKAKDDEKDKNILKFSAITSAIGTLTLFLMLASLMDHIGIITFLLIILFTFAVIFSSIICVSYFMNYISTSINDDKNFKINEAREKGVKQLTKFSILSLLMSSCIIAFFALMSSLFDETIYNFFTPEIVIMIVMILLVTFSVNFMIGLLVFLEHEEKPKPKRKRKSTKTVKKSA